MPTQPYLSSNQLVQSLILSPNEDYVYVNIPKSGCSTVKNSLWQFEYERGNTPHEELREGADLHSRTDSPFRFFRPSRAADVLRMIDRAYVFTFVRNPFSHFLDLLLEADPAELDPHFKPQNIICQAGHLSIDFIGRLETFDVDFRRVARVLGFQGQSRPWIRHRTGAQQKVNELYSDEDVERVREIYQDDFEYFGYSTELDGVGTAQYDPVVLPFPNERSGHFRNLLLGLQARADQEHEKALLHFQNAQPRIGDDPLVDWEIFRTLKECGRLREARNLIGDTRAKHPESLRVKRAYNVKRPFAS